MCAFSGNMSCSTPAFIIKMEESDQSDSIFDKNKADNLTLRSQQDTSNYDHRTDVARSVLFRKYLNTKFEHSSTLSKTIEEESAAMRRNIPCIPLMPPMRGHTSRPLSLLEERLYPVMKQDVMLPTASGEKSSTAQLTIFYSGAVSVYDNVSIDQAQAIMLIANSSSNSPPLVTNTPKVDVAKPHHDQLLNFPALCTVQADLPLARKISLKRFLEKRRRRISNKSPYAAPSGGTRQNGKDDQEQRTDDNDGSNAEVGFSHSPFPSRLGYFCPISANKG